MKSKLQEFLEIEKKDHFYETSINDIAIWHYYRYYYRYRYVNSQTGTKSKSNTLSLSIFLKNSISNIIKSFVDVVKLLLLGRPVDNVVFAFPRLQCKDGEYFDKITDPVIDGSSLADSTCIMQFSFRVNYAKSRRHSSMVCSIEILYVLSYLLAPFYALFHILTFDFLKINRVFRKTKKYIPLGVKDLIFFHVNYLSYQMQAIFFKLIFKRLKVKRLFGVDRKVFEMATRSAHQLGIPVYEFQHGVTFGDTALYSGPSCPQLDPDYFLSFGEIWNGNQFGISPDKIINIGWAYKDEVKQHIVGEIKRNAVMVVSSPEISNQILDVVRELAIANPDYVFDIRCHPMERYSQEQMIVVNSYSNINLADTSIDSNFAIGQYEFVLGSNSSVIFEALSLGKKVGRICYHGIVSRKLGDLIDDGFFYLSSKDDFNAFIQNGVSQASGKAYSDFNPELVNNLPHK